MAKKKVIETFDILLKDLMDTNALFAGKMIVFGGDFRQTLPVVRSRKKKFIQESLLYSEIWNQLEKLRLSKNMRAKADPTFCEYLMRIGNGQEKPNSHNKIEIPNCFVIPFIFENQSLDLLFRVTYPDLHTCFSDASSITSRVILTTKNDFVDEINNLLIAQFPGDPKTYVAFDETIEANDQSQYEDFLHTLHPVESSFTNDKMWYILGPQSGRFVRGLRKESNPKQMLKRAVFIRISEQKMEQEKLQ
ncbi:uncharacterized protein LOC142180988 [Nicotiana tabacum]|uniref:Uncharacterized protein LOC142180988 n=1 Tax=Nicotiana tabacum TaxID=4097 RepID=A0AC58UI79_TOBAC